MPLCDQGFEHAAPEPEIIPVPVDSGTNENDVAIADIEAAASVKREQIYSQQRAAELVLEVERQAGEIAGMREILDRLVPPENGEVPVPAPVVVTQGTIGGDGPEEVAAPPDVEKKAPKGDGGYWAGYDKG